MRKGHPMMKKALLPALLAIPLAGCVSLTPEPPEQLLTLTPASTAPSGADVGGTAEAALAVVEPEAEQRLDVTRVPVQVNESSVAYLKDAVWIEKPTRLFRQLVAETIRARGGRLVVGEGDLAYGAAKGGLLALTKGIAPPPRMPPAVARGRVRLRRPSPTARPASPARN